MKNIAESGKIFVGKHDPGIKVRVHGLSTVGIDQIIILEPKSKKADTTYVKFHPWECEKNKDFDTWYFGVSYELFLRAFTEEKDTKTK